VPYTSAQIVALATQIAKVPGFTAQAGQFLNQMLEELCQNHDLEIARGVTTFTFGNVTTAAPNGIFSQSGPYTLPSDYLRSRKGMVFYIYNGTPYSMVPIDIAEYDMLVQQAGFNDFPRDFTTDMEQSPPTMYVWPPPSIVVPVTVRYFRQMPPITTPESSTVVPWFPDQTYLITELAGRLCQMADDDRWESFLSDDEDRHPGGSRVQLRRYLKMKDDPEGKVNTVELDRRRFGTNWNRLPNTKIIGW
jgi:hypothetical protein